VTGQSAGLILSILCLPGIAFGLQPNGLAQVSSESIGADACHPSTDREPILSDQTVPLLTKPTGYCKWGDQQDGTYVNPVLPGDFSDLDVIRVGEDFYAITSTMQYSPGMAVLHSNDLVNWKIIGHVVQDLKELDPELNWDRMNRAGRGIWAGSIRYHEGRFWVYFGTPDQGIFMSSALSPGGEWTAPRLVLRAPGWDDPCPFWDGDGQGYLVATHFAPEGARKTRYNIHLFKFTANNVGISLASDRVLHRSEGSEANKLYKISGLYYHFYSEVRPEGRVPMIERSASLNGPWQSHLLMHVHGASDGEPNQGGLVELSSGNWYFLSHQGRGDWEGRAGVLVPVTWVDGWPLPGTIGQDKAGAMQWNGDKPIHGFPATDLSASDSFDESILRPEWEWNYQPKEGMWSLGAHPGFLRMFAYPPLRANNFHMIGNVLTQRSLRTKSNEVVVKLELSGMVDGQQAGLAHFAVNYCSVQIVQTGNSRTLLYETNGIRTVGRALDGTSIYLRSSWEMDGHNRFFYSDNGKEWEPIGNSCRLSWGDYRGDRIGIFTTNRKATAGYIDVDSFQYHVQR
jgi:beta-xylosidase